MDNIHVCEISGLFICSVKYRHPAAFFNPNVRLNALVQALEGINYHYLDVPEGCHLHPNVEVDIRFL